MVRLILIINKNVRPIRLARCRLPARTRTEPEPNQNRARTRTRIRTSHHPSSPLVWDGDYSRDAFPSNPSNPSLPSHPSHPNYHQSHQTVRRLQIPPILIPPICQDQKDERRVAVWLYGCMDCTAVRYAAALCPLCRPLSWPSGALNPFCCFAVSISRTSILCSEHSYDPWSTPYGGGGGRADELSMREDKQAWRYLARCPYGKEGRVMQHFCLPDERITNPDASDWLCIFFLIVFTARSGSKRAIDHFFSQK